MGHVAGKWDFAGSCTTYRLVALLCIACCRCKSRSRPSEPFRVFLVDEAEPWIITGAFPGLGICCRLISTTSRHTRKASEHTKNLIIGRCLVHGRMALCADHQCSCCKRILVWSGVVLNLISYKRKNLEHLQKSREESETAVGDSTGAQAACFLSSMAEQNDRRQRRTSAGRPH